MIKKMPYSIQPGAGKPWPLIITATLLILILGSIAFIIVTRFLPSGGAGMGAMVVAVEMTAPQLTTVDATYTTQGSIRAREQVDMNTEVPGTVSRILVTEGQPVRKGQVLMELRNDKQAAQLAETQASLLTSRDTVASREAEQKRARADLNAAEANRKLAQTEYDRYQKLHDQELISVLELEQKRAAMVQANSMSDAAAETLNATESQIRQAESLSQETRARLRYTQSQFGDTLIRAPFSGFVGQKFVDPGDYVLPTEKLITVVNPSQLEVEFTVPEKYMPHLHKDSPVALRVESYPDATFNGRVFFVNPAVDPETRTLSVKAKLDDPDAHLRSGQFAWVSLVLYTKENSLVIPEEAIVPQGEKAFVYVVKNGKAHLQQVTIGERKPGSVEILSGLTPEETVITSGFQMLFDGADVRDTGGSDGAKASKSKKE